MQEISENNSLKNTSIKTHRLVDFIIAGAGKSGTRTLIHYLKQHSNICMAELGEVMYFSEVKEGNLYPLGGNYNKGEQWYQNQFDAPEKMKGDASLHYFNAPDAPDLILENVPEVKLVFLLRHPVKRFYSHYWQERKTGVVEMDFEAMFATKHERLERFYDNSSYKKNLQRFLKLFPKENILVLISEEFYANPYEQLDKISLFLNIHSFDNKQSEVVKNKSALPKYPLLDKGIRKMVRFKRDANIKLPTFIQKGISKFFFGVLKKNQKEFNYPPIPANIEAQLEKEFSKDIQFVEEFLGREIPTWKKN